MKKTLLTIIFGSVVLHLNAQQPFNSGFFESPDSFTPVSHEFLYSSLRDPETAWYNYGYDVSNMVNNGSYFRVFLFPDSTVKVNYTSGIDYVFKHSMGQVFDPVAPNFSVFSTGLYPQTPYTVDSIAFFYRYWRFQHDAPDTVVVQVYEDDAISFQPDPGWSSGASYATVNYDYTVRKGANATLEYVFLLDEDDTATAEQSILYFPVNLNVPAGKKVAATITYFPGNPYNAGDTIDTYLDPAPVNRINAFTVYEYRDEDFLIEPEFYNNELAAITDVRYNFSQNGWNGQYVPGTAWSLGIYHIDMAFLVTYDLDVIAVPDLSGDLEQVRIFPNPVSGKSIVLSTSHVEKSFQVSILTSDGRKIKTFEAESNEEIDISGISAGIYLVRIEGEQLKKNLKLVVAD